MNEPSKPVWSVLLIVKDAMVRDLISLVVERLGGEVFSVETEEAARQAVSDKRPEVVILDLLAPGINSIALIKEIKALAAPFMKGFIAISGLAYREVVSRTIQAGATDFLLKPIDTDHLAARLEKLVFS
jgi:DNA-binding response OmpR family regulator